MNGGRVGSTTVLFHIGAGFLLCALYSTVAESYTDNLGFILPLKWIDLWIDSKKSIPPAYVAWRAGTTDRIIVPARQAIKAGGIDSWAP